MKSNNEIIEKTYTKDEEALWASLWQEGWEADKENLIKTYRQLTQHHEAGVERAKVAQLQEVTKNPKWPMTVPIVIGVGLILGVIIARLVIPSLV